ncbi:FAD-dependent monooxygenase [Streptomyces corynorhini]|uniref:Monooxygenase n=1 Tax=Streptomyces corynorhini TaxID=2282652 RepID=A0A370B3G2_9ACTN|nr:FAD-dependent monooxygenase [Streptomyces corynorhini]RDG36348.1 monooxygenase [Streptomyces corynorhini]
MRQTGQVVVAGGGPVGLWLAAELRLGGVEVTVLESRREPDPHSKALTIHPRTIEILSCRGAADPFLAEGVRIPSGHFGGLDDRMDFRVLDTPFPFTLALPQARTEELLEAHAVAAGARVLRGHRVTGLVEHRDAVTVSVTGPDGPWTLEAEHVVGCDGTRSTVRAAAGIEFPGTEATTWGWLGDVVLERPPAGPGVSVSNAAGGMMAVRLPGGLHRLVGGTPEDVRPEHGGELTLDELRAKTVRIAGDDFGMRDPVWLSRFGNATRQAARYRRGRVLLAGDAAHMHFPTGGVGLNVGFQDATNLGWKLAATVRGTAADGLLDSYHAERHPVGAALLESTRAQTALMTAYTAEGQALRAFLSRLVATVPAFSKELAERLAALDVAYPPVGPGAAGAHPLTGRRAPDLAFGSADSRGAAPAPGLFALLRAGRPVLLDLTGTPGARSADLAPGVLVHSARPAGTRAEWSGVRAALVRPDGHVAWAGTEPDDGDLWAAALTAIRTTVRTAVRAAGRESAPDPR